MMKCAACHDEMFRKSGPEGRGRETEEGIGGLVTWGNRFV